MRRITYFSAILVFGTLATIGLMFKIVLHENVEKGRLEIIRETEEDTLLEQKESPGLSLKKDLPVRYLSDTNLDVSMRQTLESKTRSSYKLPSEASEDRRRIVGYKMERFRLADDFRFCVNEVPMEGPFDFIKESKNPCWYNKEGLLQCIPYFYVAGVSKSGSSDIYSRLILHPQIYRGGEKEKHWLDFFRYYKGKESISTYASMFGTFPSIVKQGMDSEGYSDSIIGDGTPCYFFFSMYWPCYEGNKGLTEPKYTNADVIYKMNPRAKIIISMRDPANRLFSRYMTLLNGKKANSRWFHKTTSRAIDAYIACIHEWSPRHCAYNGTLYQMTQSRLQEGMYSIYLRDWLKVFPREQIFIFKFEDYIQDIPKYLKKLYDFLGLEPLPDRLVQKIAGRRKKNASKKKSGSMLPETEVMLRNFYRQYNKDLQDLLGESSWSWGYENDV